MDDDNTLILNNREEALELATRATEAKVSAQQTLMTLNRQLFAARAKLAEAVSDWARGDAAPLTPYQLSRQHVEAQTAARIANPSRSQAKQFVLKRMNGFGPHGSTNAKTSGAMPLTALLSKQQRELNAGIGSGPLPTSFRATPPAPPGDDPNK
jgi:hypothetical protein